jgi:hypothetical protein
MVGGEKQRIGFVKARMQNEFHGTHNAMREDLHAANQHEAQ